MKYFLDTEFLEDGTRLDLVSLGIVAEDGRTFYRQAVEAPLRLANAWVQANVLPHLEDRVEGYPHSLQYHPPTTVYRSEIARDLVEFCDPARYGKPEFWGYYADYDWVAICQVFGAMVELPKGWPMYCRDLKQWCDDLGNPELPARVNTAHHALLDARWNKRAWEFLQARAAEPLELHSNCDPTRKPGGPQPGDVSWLFTVPLHDGRLLHLRMGEPGRQTLRSLVLWEELDTAADEAARALGPR